LETVFRHKAPRLIEGTRKIGSGDQRANAFAH
jgi:hypothetical protein